MSKKNPMEIVARYAALSEMRKMKPEDIYKVDPEFILKYFIDSTSDDGTPISEEVYETNWYYALFTAPMAKIEKLFAAFKPTAVSQIILPEVPKIILS